MFGALFEVAEDLLPETPAAVRLRLRARSSEAASPRAEGGVKLLPGTPARNAVAVAVAFEPWCFDELLVASAAGHRRLYRVAGLLRDALATIGHEYPVEAVEDELWALAREVAPGSEAARQDVARIEALMARAESYVEEHDPDGALSEEERAGHEVRALGAIRDHDLPGLRDALRGLCVAARDAARLRERASAGSPAALALAY